MVSADRGEAEKRNREMASYGCDQIRPAQSKGRTDILGSVKQLNKEKRKYYQEE